MTTINANEIGAVMAEPSACAVHTEKLTKLEKSDEDQWKHINSIHDQLGRLVPVWTTLVLMAMSALTASALTFAGMMVKFIGTR